MTNNRRRDGNIKTTTEREIMQWRFWTWEKYSNETDDLYCLTDGEFLTFGRKQAVIKAEDSHKRSSLLMFHCAAYDSNQGSFDASMECHTILCTILLHQWSNVTYCSRGHDAKSVKKTPFIGECHVTQDYLIGLFYMHKSFLCETNVVFMKFSNDVTRTWNRTNLIISVLSPVVDHCPLSFDNTAILFVNKLCMDWLHIVSLYYLFSDA